MDDDLFTWTHVRASDPVTARSAAADAKFQAAKTKRQILRVLAEQGPMTPDEIKHELRFDCHQRVSDLANIDGMIDDTGTTRPSDRGSSMIVWAINEKGRQQLQ
jgi:hypothetical protein